jgi:ERCC4-related helicase
MEDGHEVREYQKELAGPGIQGKNYIIIAPTGSGKTVVAGLVISDHLQKNQKEQSCHVVFVVNTKPLAEQQKRQLKGLIPGARVEVYTGDNPGTVSDSIKHMNNISVCTAGKLLDEIRKGHVKFNQLSLMIFDECHHARKGHPYARLMEHYLEYKEMASKTTQASKKTLPQIIGMTASPGAGDNSDLDKKKTIDHLLTLAAILDTDGGFQTVTRNLAELQRTTKSSSRTRKILQPRSTTDDPFIDWVAREMTELEDLVPKMKNSFQRWSQEYETRVQQVKQPLESDCNEKLRDDISTLNLLRCYSNALRVYMDLRQQDAVKEIERYTGFPENDEKATRHERLMKYRMKNLLEKLKRLPPKDNPLLESMKETLRDTFKEKQTFRAILFIRTKKHAHAVSDWVRQHHELQDTIKPEVITGHARETGPGMTQVEQKDVMDRFRTGKTNLLIATSVAEEGLDVPECNLVIRFQHVSNEIAQVQTEGRARAENSQGITILSSDSSKKYRELKNMELNVLVEEILESNFFPVGLHLKKQLNKIQDTIISHRRMKATLRAKRRASHDSEDVKLFCKTCKQFACSGSDVHMIGKDGSHHYVIPEPAFGEKITCKDYQMQRDLIPNVVRGTHKIHCAKCDREWGVKCIWPTDGHTFPVIKCAAFIFHINGVQCPVKKWSDAPFEMKDLSEWLSNNSLDDSYDSSSSDTEQSSD